MTAAQWYLIILLSSLILGFIPWILMQMYFEWEIFWGRIAVFGFISSIVTILIGIFLLVNWILTL